MPNHVNSALRLYRSSSEGAKLAENMATLKQVRLIRGAIDGYSIVGAWALKEGACTAPGEMIDVEKTIKENGGPREIGELIDVWKKTYLLANSAIDGGKVREISKTPWLYFCPDPA